MRIVLALLVSLFFSLPSHARIDGQVPWATPGIIGAVTPNDFYYTEAVGLTATGTNQGTAFALTTEHSVFTTVASGTGCIARIALRAGLKQFVDNDGANALLIYPPVGGAFDGGTVNIPISLPAGAFVSIISTGTTNYDTLISVDPVFNSTKATLGFGSGASPSSIHPIALQTSNNSEYSIFLANTNGGTAAFSEMYLSNAAHGAHFGLLGTGYSAIGMYLPDQLYVGGNMAALMLYTNNASGVLDFASGSFVRAGRISTAQNWLFGNLTADSTNAQIQIAAGTASKAPIQFNSGTNLTTPAAGVQEYDGVIFYSTPVASNRGVNLTEHYVNNSAVQTGTNVNTAQPWFVTTLTNGQITLPSSTTYEFEGLLAVATTGTTSHTIAIGFGGGATLTSIGYSVNVQENATSLATITPVSRFSAFLNTAASTVVTTAVATATYDTIEVKGTVRINAGGTFIPQFTYSAAPGVAPTIAIGTYFRMRPLGSNTVTNVGNWN